MDQKHGRDGSEPARLESWKEIARYLGRAVRTVQMWERTEGLPVRRHWHNRRGTVFAYATDLDGWLELRTVKAGGGHAPVSLPASRPRSFNSNAFLARTLVENDRLHDARPFLDAASSLVSEGDDEKHPYQAAWIRLWPSHEAWLRGDAEESERLLDDLELSLEARSGRSMRVFGRFVAAGYEALGQAKRCLEIQKNTQRESLHSWFDGLYAWLRNDVAGVDNHLVRSCLGDSAAPHVEPPRLILLANNAEYLEVARRGLAEFEAAYPESPAIPAIHAQLPLTEGRTDEGIDLLKACSEDQHKLGEFTSYGIATALADALVPEGRLLEAAEVLEEVGVRKLASYPYNRSTWLGVETRRYGIYRLLGQPARAAEVEGGLRSSLARADDDNWVVHDLDEVAGRSTACAVATWWRVSR